MRGALLLVALGACGGDGPTQAPSDEPQRLQVERGEVLCAALEGDLLLAGTSKDHLLTWSLPGGELVDDARGHRRGILCVALAPGGGRLASGGPDRTVRLWSPGPLHETHTLRGFERPPIALAFAPEGALVAVTMGGELCTWDAASGAPRLARPGPSQRGVMAVALSADGTRMVWAADGGNLRVWDTATGDRVGSLRVDGLGFVAAVAIAPDRRIAKGYVATAQRDGPRVSVWDLEGERLVSEFEAAGTCRALAFNPGGLRCAVSTTAGTVQIFDARTGLELRRWDFPGGEVRRLSYARKGKRLVVVGPEAHLSWIDVSGISLPVEVSGVLLDAPVMRRADMAASDQWPTSGPIDMRQLAWPDYDPPELRPDPEPIPHREFPERIRQLHGETVTVTGYPLSTTMEEGGRRFLLSRFPPGCCFGAVPVADEWIEITVRGEPALFVPEVPIEVTGVLEVGEVLDELGFVQSLYRLKW